MADAPEIGSVVEIEGHGPCVRLPSVPEQLNERPVHFTSMQLPNRWKYAKDFDKHGAPRFSSKKALGEALARGNAHGEGVYWDGRPL